jgi:quercetin dioxygenase-like cupin family protein
MKRCIFLILLTASIAAQTPPEVEITAEPHHHQVLVNDQVRAFYVDVAPHADTLMHWHRHDYIYVTLGATHVVNAVKGKDPVTVNLNDGDTDLLHSGFAHLARNVADTPFRNVTVELLQDEKLRHSTHHWDANQGGDRGLQILHGGTQEILWVKDAVRASEVELQMGASLPHDHAGPFLLVALIDCELQSDTAKAPTTITLKTGDAHWLPANTKALTNAAHTAAKFITLEFP